MSLAREVYEALEAVVGKRWISEDEFVLAGNRVKTPEVPFTYHSADAIILPETTEQVQEIIRICNKHGVCFVPLVSGVSAEAFANRPGTVLIQMSRMNKIVEINETDRYAVIEPGVRHVQLYPELRRRGFSYTAAAVGPGGSVLANFTSSSGDHHNQHNASRSNRYLLGAEFVTPEGEIVRTGSLANGAGWFCPDGPGPGLRALMKGYFGNHGQFGVITRIAIGLLPCNGPAEIEQEGISPYHKVWMNSPCSKVYVFNYEHIYNVRDAMLKIGEAEIAATVLKYFYLPAILMMTNSADEFWEKWEGGYKEALSMPLVVHLATQSEAEMAYEEKILFEIVEETGGKRIPREIEQWWDEHMDFFMVVGRLQSVLRLGGGWMPNKLASDSVSHICEVGATVNELLSEFTESGKLFDAPESYQIIPMEYGHFAHIEVLIMWDRTNPAAGRGVGEYRMRSRNNDIEKHFHAETPGSLNAGMEQIGPLYCNANVWLRKIKESLDPNNIANPLM